MTVKSILTKHSSTALFHKVYQRIEEIVSTDRLDVLTNAALYRMRQEYDHSEEAGYLWSMGKDSVALQWLCEEAGITKSYMVLPHKSLEWPINDNWWDRCKPAELRITRIEEISAELYYPGERWHEHLFARPHGQEVSDEWYQLKWPYMRAWPVEENLKVTFAGRRTKDGNFCGPDGRYELKNGVVVSNPMYDWTHEELLAFLKYHKIELPPSYWLPQGFEGTSHWWTDYESDSQYAGWLDLAEHDPVLPRRYQDVFPEARKALKAKGMV